jgi:hypothetical protein
MTHFLLQSFAQDEDIQTIHLPIILAALAELLHVSKQQQTLLVLTLLSTG